MISTHTYETTIASLVIGVLTVTAILMALPWVIIGFARYLSLVGDTLGVPFP